MFWVGGEGGTTNIRGVSYTTRSALRDDLTLLIQAGTRSSRTAGEIFITYCCTVSCCCYCFRVVQLCGSQLEREVTTNESKMTTSTLLCTASIGRASSREPCPVCAGVVGCCPNGGVRSCATCDARRRVSLVLLARALPSVQPCMVGGIPLFSLFRLLPTVLSSKKGSCCYRRSKHADRQTSRHTADGILPYDRIPLTDP